MHRLRIEQVAQGRGGQITESVELFQDELCESAALSLAATPTADYTQFDSLHEQVRATSKTSFAVHPDEA